MISIIVDFLPQIQRIPKSTGLKLSDKKMFAISKTISRGDSSVFRLENAKAILQPLQRFCSEFFYSF
jgi:hypothetical protein